MKKLVHGEYDITMQMEENSVNVLVVENPAIMAELVQELSGQSEGGEGRFVLSEDGRVLSVDKGLVFVKEPFSLDINQKKVLAKLYAELEVYTNDVFVQERMAFYQAYNQYMDAICKKSMLFLDYKEEPDMQEIFKISKLQIADQTEDLLQQVVAYMKVVKELLHQDIFVFLNLKLFLTEEELCALYKECFYRKIHLILVESVFKEKKAQESVCVIDKDACIIYL